MKGRKAKKSRFAEVIIGDRYVHKKYRNGMLSAALFYRELKNIKSFQRYGFIPRLAGVSRRIITMEKISGDFIHHLRTPPVDICENLAKSVGEFHRDWVFHLDLRQRKNFLITRDNRVFIIDFQSCVKLPRFGLFRPVAELLRTLDIGGLLRLKSRYFSRYMKPDETRYLKRFNMLRRLWIVRPFKRRKGDL